MKERLRYTNPPSRAEMSADTRELHDAVDDAIRRDGKPFLHPDGQSIQLDLLGSAPMIAWQEEKARLSFLAEDCWSHLPTTYARYGSESTRALVSEMNEVMDLVAMRGGILDWRRSQSIVTALDEARARFERRCQNASAVASFLSGHGRVSEVHHPSLPEHPDADVIATHYSLPGSLLSFRLDGADDDTTRHFCDVLAMTRVPRYALSFDGLVTKVNHHRSVSEYWATENEARALGIDKLVRLGVGLEAADDLIACLDWALASYPDVSEDDVRQWQQERRRELNLEPEPEPEPEPE